MRTFADTNIWVYAADPTDPLKQRIARECTTADAASMVVSVQVMGELYVTLVRKATSPMDRRAARAIVECLSRLHVVPLEASDVLHALELTATAQLSYWDALIVAAASRARCDRILTEDLAHGTTIDGVRIENPFLGGDRSLAEARALYEDGPRTWDDAALREALAAYEDACRAAGMRPNAVHSYWDHARRFLDWRDGAYPRNTSARPVPARAVGIAELVAEAEAYGGFVAGSGLSPASAETYVRHARLFVRWLDGRFTPGGRLGATRSSGPTQPVSGRTWTRDDLYAERLDRYGVRRGG